MRRVFRSPLDSLALFIVAAGMGSLMAAAFPFFISVDGRYETLNAAKTLAETGVLGNPFATGASGPTAHVAPLFPAIAAGLSLLPFPWKYSLLIFGLMLCGAIAALLPWASQLLFGSRRPGQYAGALSCFSVALIPQSDVILSCFLTLAACCAVASASKWAPVVCAAAILSNPVCILPLAMCSLTTSRRLWSIGVISALICGPWIFRNWIELGAPVPIRDNFGLELSIANNDCAGPTFYDNIFSRCFQTRHPNYSQAELVSVRSFGEVRYNSIKLHQAFTWIRSHLRRFASLTAQRVFYYLFPSPTQGPWAFGIWIVTVLGSLSFFAPPTVTIRMLQISAFLSWLPYAAVQSDLRYRTVSLWCWLLLAGIAICEIRKSRLFPFDHGDV